MSATAPTVPSPAGNSENETPEQDRLLEQYKTYLDTIARSAEERLHINELFMTINNFLATILTGLGGYTVFSGNSSLALLLFILSIMGYAFSRVWHLYLTNYTTVNSAKWKVVYDMEEKFRFTYHPFQEEWSGKGELESKEGNPPDYLSWLWTSSGGYYKTSKVEGALPKLFGGIYIVLMLFTAPFTIWNIWEWFSSNVSFFETLEKSDLAGVGIVFLSFLALAIVVVGRIALPLVRKWVGEG